jgi:glutamyl-tRNA synthetase
VLSNYASLSRYRGRLAPSPTGHLHLGHARTFWIAQERAQSRQGVLVLRNEDLDPARSKSEFSSTMLQDLRWFGLQWQEGPDCGGSFGPYSQSQRRSFYVAVFQKLLAGALVYPCTCSRKEVQRAAQAPHAGEDEPVYPGTCRAKAAGGFAQPLDGSEPSRLRCHWRFRVPDGEVVSFFDGAQGRRSFTAGKDFGDFVVWRQDDVPAYQLAVVADDAAMEISEVVRGADLLLSTARQILLYRALGLVPPAFYHCPLMTDQNGMRLAKRRESLSLRALRERGDSPESLRRLWNF